MGNDHIDIALATYNGGRFLAEQLRSLQAQTHLNWILFARDDGSTDNTLRLLQAFADENPGRVILLSDDHGRLGVTGNFNAVLSATRGRYVALADQDDVWLPEKLASLLTEMASAEASAPSGTPVLVHSDARVVDASLADSAPSLWRYGALDVVTGARFHRMLLTNVATGCTTLVNRALLDVALPIPQEAAMHDWWLALAASAFGELRALAQPTVLYRQHEHNEAGAQPYQPISTLLRAASRPSGQMRTTLLRSQRQARAFVHRFSDRLSSRHASAAREYGALQGSGFIKRRAFLLGSGIVYPDLVRTLMLLAVV